ncbi:hypothetical protein GCM10010985_57060 [Caballeronia grimmiae]|uniref:Uncharacterized protein n=1 Tax=Caballeronia grimmiae TaxID=1071679 RepID=A0ABQ1S7P8_9BURK|nr:hypothetical protein GCM10010985_57060 [Caballeronia grimmiae]
MAGPVVAAQVVAALVATAQAAGWRQGPAVGPVWALAQAVVVLATRAVRQAVTQAPPAA